MSKTPANCVTPASTSVTESVSTTTLNTLLAGFIGLETALTEGVLILT